jgi:molybdopterin/thiamine biosynthesis adenylyltransferase
MPRLSGDSLSIIGLDRLGASIAVGIPKGPGIKTLYLFDNQTVSQHDAEHVPCYQAADVGMKTRSEAMAVFLLAKFPGFDVRVLSCNGASSVPDSVVGVADIALFTTSNRTELIRYNEYCRAQQPPVCFLNACSLGMVGYTFIDRGINKDKSYRYCTLNSAASSSVSLFDREIKTDGDLHAMVNGIAAFVEENGYMPEFKNESHAAQVLKRSEEFLCKCANDLTLCSDYEMALKAKDWSPPAFEELSKKLSYHTSIPFPPIQDFLCGAILAYIGQYARHCSMAVGCGWEFEELEKRAAQYDTPLTYYDATRIPMVAQVPSSTNGDFEAKYVPIYKSMKPRPVTDEKYIMYSDGTYLVHALSSLTRLGMSAAEDGRLLIVTSTALSDSTRSEIDRKKSTFFSGKIEYLLLNDVNEKEYTTANGAIIFAPNGKSEDIVHFTNSCSHAKQNLLSCVMAPRVDNKQFALLCTPTTVGIADIYQKKEGEADDDGEEKLDESDLEKFPWNYIENMPDPVAPAAFKLSGTWEPFVTRAFELFKDRFVRVKQNTKDIATDPKRFVRSLNSQKFTRKKRYLDQISSTATVLMLAATAEKKTVALENAIGMFQTSFPYICNSADMASRKMVLVLKTAFINNAAKLYLHLVHEHKDNALDDTSDTIQKLEQGAPACNGHLQDDPDDGTVKSLPKEFRQAIIDVAAAFKKKGTEKIKYDSLVWDLQAGKGVTPICINFLEAASQLFMTEKSVKNPVGAKCEPLMHDKDARAWISSRMNKTLGGEMVMRPAKAHMASALLSLETFRRLTLEEKEKVDDSLVFNVIFETFDNAFFSEGKGAFLLSSEKYMENPSYQKKGEAPEPVKKEESDSSDDSANEESLGAIDATSASEEEEASEVAGEEDEAEVEGEEGSDSGAEEEY